MMFFLCAYLAVGVIIVWSLIEILEDITGESLDPRFVERTSGVILLTVLAWPLVVLYAYHTDDE